MTDEAEKHLMELVIAATYNYHLNYNQQMAVLRECRNQISEEAILAHANQDLTNPAVVDMEATIDIIVASMVGAFKGDDD